MLSTNEYSPEMPVEKSFTKLIFMFYGIGERNDLRITVNPSSFARFGFYNPASNDFSIRGKYGYFWSSKTNNMNGFGLSFSGDSLVTASYANNAGVNYKLHGYSVRCGAYLAGQKIPYVPKGGC